MMNEETNHIRTAVADERLRIARDLHDSALSEITGVALALHSVRHLLPTPEQAKLDQAIRGLDTVIRGVRDAVFELTQPAEPLQAQLIRRVHHFDTLCIQELSLSTSAVLPDLPGHVQCDIIAVLTEAITNAAKYSEATFIDIDVRWEQGELLLIVADDGVGIPLTTMTPQLLPMTGNGLSNMAFRADRHGGRFGVEASAAGGTTVMWTIPFEQNRASVTSHTPARSAHREVTRL